MTRNCLMAAMLGLLVACGGGGGGDRATGVEPGPPGSGPVDPPPPVIPAPNPAPYVEATELLATITSVILDGDNHATVEFQLTDGQGTAIIDLEAGNVRFTISKLQGSDLGNLTGTWQSYVNNVADPAVGIGTVPQLQATYEREADNFVNNDDGTYTYTFALSLNDLPADVLAQADVEGLDLSFEADRTHRVAMQFDGNPNTTANPFYDWVPATGAAGNVFNMDIAATANCNNCHDPLGIHGGNRQEIQYCVTCHNAGSTDPDSTNTVDMKVMIHKIHRGANLPSVQEGGQYVIYGYRNGEHDYSNLHYPQDIRNCVNCHAGTRTGAGRDDLTLTSQGDNWAEVPSGAACESCHDAGWVPGHIAGKEDTECASCHSAGGYAGSIEDSHRMLIQEKREEFLAQITDVSNTGPGESPMVTFSIVNPLDDNKPYDLKNDPIFEPYGIRIGNAWSTSDYTNTGNGDITANQVQADAILGSTDNGDGTYTVTMPPIPDGSELPGVAASGSGMASIEGHPVVEMVLDDKVGPESVQIPLGDAHMFFSIDEVDGDPEPRRPGPKDQAETLEKCQACHQTLVLHGNNRADNLDTCVSCHNPRNTDRQRREMDEVWCDAPPTDGKQEESVDFKTMIHAIHAAETRENPLQIVGYNCYTTHVYDTDTIHYPGNEANCETCHVGDSFTLPVADGVLGTTVDTGDDRHDPADDTVVTPEAAVCSSCHDDSKATAHMVNPGGANFSTTQQAIDDGEVVETCSVCHGSGKSDDAWKIHQTFLNR